MAVLDVGHVVYQVVLVALTALGLCLQTHLLEEQVALLRIPQLVIPLILPEVQEYLEELVQEGDDVVVPLPLGLDDGALVLLPHDALAVQRDEVEELVDLAGNALEVYLQQFLRQELLSKLFRELLDEIAVITQIPELNIDNLVILPDEFDEYEAVDVVVHFGVLLQNGAL